MDQKPIKSLRNKFSTNTKFSEAFQIQDSVLQGPTELYELQAIDLEFPKIFECFSNLNCNFNSTMIFNTPTMFQNNIQMDSKTLTAEQMRILCQIDILMLRHYYLLRKEVFKKHNQLFLKQQEKNINNNILQIKKRFQHHYQDKIAMMLCKLLDEVRNKEDKEFIENNINDVQFIPAELIELDIKLKQQPIESLDYCDPLQVYQEITKLLEMFLKSI
ncbi:unnamed protein product [Paramecium pentaurelia]|uniref:Uncharacterized protein n=1 Tax=Paramecium pentaurelia TaxID=43138 RepID=A0A8S1XWW5_9CILI|nr:unnamed protein product [Paramecium pentaurelia]